MSVLSVAVNVDVDDDGDGDDKLGLTLDSRRSLHHRTSREFGQKKYISSAQCVYKIRTLNRIHRRRCEVYTLGMLPNKAHPTIQSKEK